MTIAKWMPFGTQSVAVASQTAKPQHVQVTPADAKQFGLENVRYSLSAVPVRVYIIECRVDHPVWQYLVCLFIYSKFCTHHPRCSYANSVLQALYFCSPFREL